MTTPANPKTIPVPVDVLRALLKDNAFAEYEGMECGVCEGQYGHTPTCPIPALREAVEESEKR